MYVVTLAILIDEPAEELIYAGIEYLKAVVVLRKDFLQCFDFLLQCVKARHIGGQGNVTASQSRIRLPPEPELPCVCVCVEGEQITAPQTTTTST